MTREHIYQVEARERNIRALAAMDTSDKPEADKLDKAAKLVNATIRATYQYQRLTEDENDSRNYATEWQERKLAEREDRINARIERLTERWRWYGLDLAWPGLYPCITKFEPGKSTIGAEVIDLCFYK